MNLRNCFGPCLLGQSSHVLSLVEHIEPHRIDRTRGPQPHRIHMPASPPHDRNVVGHSFDCLIRMPDAAGNAPRSENSLDPAAQGYDVIDPFGAFELPRISERQPFLRIFVLPSVTNNLAEQAMIVSNSVAISRYPQCCRALHETGGETPEAAIPKRGVRLRRTQPHKIDTEIAKRGIDHFAEPQISQCIVE